MAAESEIQEVIAVDSGAHEDEHAGPGLMDLSVPMMIWTWAVFGILFFILYKAALKPILAALDRREESIRNSVEEADEIKRTLAEIKSTQEGMLAEADAEAKAVVMKSRAAATEAARVIERKAKEDAQIVLENAQREIRTIREKAEASLKRDSAEMAITLAGKIIGENLDDERNRNLTDKLISEL
jgi:F-type H+-transporting ATPase subunit b